MTRIQEALKKYFGYEEFREYQENIITNIIEGRDVVGIMPTGAGKSLCYQLPAILSEGITIVISPLISLMKDQVDYLNSIGVESAYLNSSLSGTEHQKILNGIYHNKYKLIYVAPERLENEVFIEAINVEDIHVSNLIIDEAHCVSRWGHDFRPSYTNIAQFILRLKRRPTIAAFTATATNNVKDDIIASLGLKNPQIFLTSFDRKNLEFKVFVNENKEQYIKNYIKNHSQESGIIYTATRKDAEKLYNNLIATGIHTSIYHAGLSDAERMRAQEDFIYDNTPVMIATNAFGMGIDKSNVRYVIHYNMPRDLESYYQEAGRAGRDGEKSVCILLYSASDTAIQKYFIDESYISDDRKSHEYKKLQLMESYCHTSTCLRKYILEYFEDYSLKEPCGNCSVCNTEVEEKDITLQAQMILSCINRSGQRFGRSIIVDTLRGSKNQKVLKFNLNELKTYGLMKDYPKDELDLLMNKLIADGYLNKTEEQYPILKLTNLSIPLLKNQARLSIQLAKKEEKAATDNILLTKLKDVRLRIAKKEGYPPYVIFHDSTLIEMSRLLPKTLDELSQIKGIGENKRIKYGKAFLEVIVSYCNTYDDHQEKNSDEFNVNNEGTINSDYIDDTNPVDYGYENYDNQYEYPNVYSDYKDNSAVQKDLFEYIENNDEGYKTQYNNEETQSSEAVDISKDKVKQKSYLKYLRLYLEGKTMDEIKDIIGVTLLTVEKNLMDAYEIGENISIDDFIQKDFELEVVRILLSDDFNGKLKYIKERVDEIVTYTTIRAVIVKLKKKLKYFES